MFNQHHSQLKHLQIDLEKKFLLDVQLFTNFINHPNFFPKQSQHVIRFA